MSDSSGAFTVTGDWLAGTISAKHIYEGAPGDAPIESAKVVLPYDPSKKLRLTVDYDSYIKLRAEVKRQQADLDRIYDSVPTGKDPVKYIAGLVQEVILAKMKNRLAKELLAI